MSVDEVRAVIRRLLDQGVTLKRLVGLLESPALPPATIRKLYPEARKVWLNRQLRLAAQDIAQGNSHPAAAKKYGITVAALQDYLKKISLVDDHAGGGYRLKQNMDRAHKEFKRLRLYLGQAWGWSRGKDVVSEGSCSASEWMKALEKLTQETEQARKIILDHFSKFKQWSEETSHE